MQPLLKLTQTSALVVGALLGSGVPLHGNQTLAQPSETPRFFYKGGLMTDTTIPGEQKKDNAVPTNAICWQLSRDRFMWIYVIGTFQGADSVRAIAYQIRRDAPDGPLVNEAILSAANNRWDFLGNGELFFKQQGHGKVFGVPKGAVDRHGRVLPNNNVFCAMWYQVPRPIDRKTGRLLLAREIAGINAQGSHEHRTRLAQVQFRLNDAGDNVEFLTPICVLAERGHEAGPDFCSLGTQVTGVNHWYTPLAPADEACTRWVDVRHFYPGGVAPVLMEFNPRTRLYEWVKTGRLTHLRQGAMIECFVNRVGKDWIVGARGFRNRDGSGTETIWFKTRDLFSGDGLGEPILTPSPGPPHANRSGYVCGDGVLRIFGGYTELSPFNWARNPQYCWDVDPQTFALSNCRTVLSTDDIGMASTRGVKFRTFLSAPWQNRQLVTITVKREIFGRPTEEEMQTSGVHYWYMTCDRTMPDTWRFGAE